MNKSTDITINNLLDIEFNFFIDRLNDKPKSIKKQFHYRSVLNIYTALKSLIDNESEKYKQNLLFFFYELKDCNYEIDSRVQSVILYKDYLVEIGKYLMKEKGFKTKTTVYLNIIIAAILDLILIYVIEVYSYPYLIFISILFSLIQRKFLIHNNKYFSIFW